MDELPSVCLGERAVQRDAQLFENGVDKLFERRLELTRAALAQNPDAAQFHAEQCAQFYEEDCEDFGKAEAECLKSVRAERLLAAEWKGQPPLWQQVSGLYRDIEESLRPSERAARIRRLMQRVERLLRVELRRAEARRMSAAVMRGVARVTEHTSQWDPLRGLCVYLGIAQRKLSSLSRECSGLSATQVVDALKAERLRVEMKAQLRAFLSSRKDAETAKRNESRTERAWAVWRELRDARRQRGFQRTSWAWGLSFSSYPKLFRGCLVCFGVTPSELELEVIEELLAELERDGDVPAEIALCVCECAEDGRDLHAEAQRLQRDDAGCEGKR